MIIKSMQLENIRSYEEAAIEFSTGTTLFQGDIRSGKSTILYAIEFALFGLGSMDGGFLLRNGSNDGAVGLVFDIDGQEFEVHRGLKRREKRGRNEYSISQTECWIRGPSGKMPLSASELKEEVLKILNFNEPSAARAQSVIYRYAVFTPQDEMKEVIRKDPDGRLQTLRRAFRIEDYKTAANNASTVTGAIRIKTAELTGKTGDIEEKKSELHQKNEEVEGAKRKLEPLLTQESSLDDSHKQKQDELGKLQESLGRITELEKQIPEVTSQQVEKKQEKERLGKEFRKLTDKIEKELTPEIEEAKKEKRPTTKTKVELKKEREVLKKKIKQYETQQGRLEEQQGNFQELIQKGKCPICLRPVPARDFGKTLAHVKGEMKKLDVKVGELETQAKENEELEGKLDNFEQSQKDLRKLEPQLTEATERIDEISKKELPDVEQSINDLGKKLNALEQESKKLSKLSEKIDALVEERDKLEGNLKTVRAGIGSLTNQIRQTGEDIEKLQKEIEDKLGFLKVKESLGEHKTWLADYFAPTVETIEKHVMYVIWEKMNQQFQRWFQILIEDPNLQARIDEEFTPIVTQNGFDQDYESLSGGEKTSVALAYRLALNSTVREIATGVKPNLLILDEPTDGFSKEQLFRIRDLLNELKCPQVVIVSHEEELDTCADHVFRVERVNGVSQASQLR